MANAANIRRIMAGITDDNLAMGVWAVREQDGTIRACAAGHTMLAMGVELIWKDDVVFDDQDNPSVVELAQTRLGRNGRSIPQVASEVWGVTAKEGDRLWFTDAETVDQLWELVTEVTGVTRV